MGRNFRGMPGGGNMNQMMKQAQKMQQQMEKMQEELAEKEYTTTSGGGVIEVTISGEKEIKRIKIDEMVVDPEDVEMLEDLVLTAVNEALRKVEEETQSELGKITGNMGLPKGLF